LQREPYGDNNVHRFLDATTSFRCLTFLLMLQ
jgi:hypothetical protein